MTPITIESLTANQLEYALAVALGDTDIRIERPGYNVTNIVTTDSTGIRKVRNRTGDIAQAWPLLVDVGRPEVRRDAADNGWYACGEFGCIGTRYHEQTAPLAICMLALEFALLAQGQDDCLVDIPDELLEATA